MPEILSDHRNKSAESDNKWVFKHPSNLLATTYQIPSKFFDPGKNYTRIDYYLHFYSESSTKEPIIGQELHADAFEVQITSEGNTQEIFINIKGDLKYRRKISGEPLEGFNVPPSNTGPSGIISLPDNPEPNSNEPDLNDPFNEPDPPWKRPRRKRSECRRAWGFWLIISHNFCHAY